MVNWLNLYSHTNNLKKFAMVPLSTFHTVKRAHIHIQLGRQLEVKCLAQENIEMWQAEAGIEPKTSYYKPSTLTEEPMSPQNNNKLLAFKESNVFKTLNIKLPKSLTIHLLNEMNVLQVKCLKQHKWCSWWPKSCKGLLTNTRDILGQCITVIPEIVYLLHSAQKNSCGWPFKGFWGKKYFTQQIV